MLSAKRFVPADGSTGSTSGQKYGLEGLDCGHCVETVETVDLVPDGVSRLTVSGSADESALRDAVAEAGYSFSTR